MQGFFYKIKLSSFAACKYTMAALTAIEKKTFRLHLIYQVIDGLILGALALN